MGTEVKSLREGQADLEGSYARIIENECWLIGAKIAAYAQASRGNHDPTRKRKLLLRRAQIRKITGKLTQRGFTLVPLKIYFNAPRAGEGGVALGRGKRQYDKRQKLQDEQQKKDVARDFKKYRR